MDQPEGVLGRGDQVRRNTRLLAAAQGAIQVTFPVFLIVAGPVAKDLTGTATSLGVIACVYSVAAAVGALRVGRWMDRVGRRPGLILGCAVTAVSGVLCAIAVAIASYPLLLAASVPFGVGQGASNLARGAVADMHGPAERGRAVGVLLAIGTIGAVGSPLLLIALNAALEGTTIDPDVAAWSLVILGSIAAWWFVARLRPDPRDLAVEEEGAPGPVRSGRELLAEPRYRLALAAAIGGQIAMVGVMTATPTALHDHGHGPSAISLIISVHITGMYAFGPLIGMAMDRYGRIVGLLGGALVSAAGGIAAGLGQSGAAVGLGLFLLGIGWSATFLASTAVISDLTAPNERAGALGVMDLAVALCSAVAGLLSGIVLQLAGYRLLGLGVAVVILVAIAAIALRSRFIRVPTAT